MDRGSTDGRSVLGGEADPAWDGGDADGDQDSECIVAVRLEPALARAHAMLRDHCADVVVAEVDAWLACRPGLLMAGGTPEWAAPPPPRLRFNAACTLLPEGELEGRTSAAAERAGGVALRGRRKNVAALRQLRAEGGDGPAMESLLPPLTRFALGAWATALVDRAEAARKRRGAWAGLQVQATGAVARHAAAVAQRCRTERSARCARAAAAACRDALATAAPLAARVCAAATEELGSVEEALRLAVAAAQREVDVSGWPTPASWAAVEAAVEAALSAADAVALGGAPLAAASAPLPDFHKLGEDAVARVVRTSAVTDAFARFKAEVASFDARPTVEGRKRASAAAAAWRDAAAAVEGSAESPSAAAAGDWDAPWSASPPPARASGEGRALAVVGASEGAPRQATLVEQVAAAREALCVCRAAGQAAAQSALRALRAWADGELRRGRAAVERQVAAAVGQLEGRSAPAAARIAEAAEQTWDAVQRAVRDEGGGGGMDVVDVLAAAMVAQCELGDVDFDSDVWVRGVAEAQAAIHECLGEGPAAQ